MQYQYVHKADSSVFQSGNFNAPRSGRPLTGKIDEIMEKVEQKTLVVMISVKN